MFRLFKIAIQNSLRNFWLSIVTITIFILTLLTVNIMMILNQSGQILISQAEENVEVTVALTSDASIDSAESMREYLLGLRQVRDAKIETSDEILENFIQKYADNEAIIDSLSEVDGNPFGHAVTVQATAASEFPFIVESLNIPQYEDAIEEISYYDSAAFIEKVSNSRKDIQTGGIIIAAIFTLIAGLIVLNTVRVAIYVHREEIAIMKLVGASNAYIRAPFFIEIILYALFATLLTGILTYGTLAYPGQALSRYLPIEGLMSYISEHGLLILGIQFLALSTLGIITATAAMYRYLRA